MDFYSVSNVTTNVVSTYKSSPSEIKKTDDTTSTVKEEAAAVYEKSSDTAEQTAVTKKNTDRSAIIAQMKADQEARQTQLLDIVKQTMTQQGKTIGTADDMWKFLASGDFTVDAATKAQAQADIAEDGYWGVNQTSDRILDFAKALAGNDPEQADKYLEAFKKGYEEATGTWGKTLPDISSKTYDAVLEKFEAWKNGTEEVQ